MDEQKKQHRELKGYRAPQKASDPGAFDQVEAPLRSLQDEARRRQPQKPLSRKKAALIVLVIIAAVALIWLVAWCNRSITFKLNGQDATAKVGTAIHTVIEDRHVQVSPGNFVSVSGDVLEEGQGDPFSLAVNGNTLDYAEARTYTIQESADLTVSNGANVCENYETTYKEIAPELTQQGLEGALTYVSQWPEAGSQEVRHGVISGQTADGDIIKQPKNCVLTTQNVKPANDEKLVALTFNELSASAIQAALDTLSKTGSKATFFMTGESCLQNASAAAAIVQANSQVASLSESFEPLTELDASALRDSLSQGFSAVQKGTGAKTSCLRPPYGQFNLQSWLNSEGLLSTAVFWNAEAGSATTTDAIVSVTTTNVQPGSIILAADGGANMQVEIAALPQVIKKLQDAGYKLVTLSELMKSDTSIPESCTTCSATLPEGGAWPTSVAKNLQGGQ